ncbi:SDR family oxidoreductase [Mucilaginibacter daejeonensis]|uniref:SDR family oxidoreductase n=1 Tax=Mucilaginibacter daejeonensis TaxID=398049 RepID=UPI001D173EE7|nr:SDR family oxidoreductase [Mucilaginibacter daejeonensis]UEG52752.1 SDR family oxidoreductase [Mucilaginibacter daejeonensis]
MSNKLFADQWAVILGGSSGFGHATVEKLARNGMNVALLYREPAFTEKPLLQKLDALAQECMVTILPFNINALETSGRERFLEKFQETAPKHSVKLLLHSIARGNLKPLVTEDKNADTLSTLSAEDIQMTTYAMSNSLLDWTRSLLQHDLFQPDARVIGLTSEGAHKVWEGYAAISLAKSSLESLAKYMAVEFAPYGLKTNVIQAGITATASLKKIPGSDKLIEIGETRNPMGRITKPEDVANVIYLLCMAEAFWINGALIHVDGGEHCN